MSQHVILALSKADLSELIAWAQSHYDASVMSTFGANLEQVLWDHYNELNKARPDESI